MSTGTLGGQRAAKAQAEDEQAQAQKAAEAEAPQDLAESFSVESFSFHSLAREDGGHVAAGRQRITSWLGKRSDQHGPNVA